jgi:hypothetical protein
MQSIISSIRGLLSPPKETPQRSLVQIEHIREAMLQSIGEAGCMQFPTIEGRILYADELEELWYLRSDVMMVVSTLKDETAARQSLRRITNMFEGLLPKGMSSRPAPLGE